MFLTAEELYRVTRKRRYSAQRRALDRLGVRFVPAANGEPLVQSDALDAAGKPAHRARSGHRWDRIGSIRQLKTRAA